MKNLVISMMVLAAASVAHADGFECQTPEGDLNLKVYNHVHAAEGTRVAAVMVLSDPSADSGSKTIARFTDVNETLGSAGASYDAEVDLRFNDSGHHDKDAEVLGTTLSNLKYIHVDVDFSYDQPVAAGESVSGRLEASERDGGRVTRDLDCTRYLKNQ